MKRRDTKRKNKEGGFAVLEAVAFLFAFVMLTVYVIDFFSAIHTGIVNSIAARTYLFGTLEHRSDITLLRPGSEFDYINDHMRFHAIEDGDRPDGDDTFVYSPGRVLTQVSDDDQIVGKVTNPAFDAGGNRASIILIKTGYGICIDAGCPGG